MLTKPKIQPCSVFQSTLPHGSDPLLPAILDTMTISIHAPLRERPLTSTDVKVVSSTFPYGSDYEAPACPFDTDDFNPRSLTGATRSCCFDSCPLPISIHAPLRERPARGHKTRLSDAFQSTLPHGSDFQFASSVRTCKLFQSTLPHGSDGCRWGPTSFYF